MRPIRQSQAAQAGPSAPVAACRADEYMMEIIPGYKPKGEDGLNSLMAMWRADTPEKREACLKAFNALTEDNIKKRGVVVVGMKPRPDDQHIYSVRIPNSPLAIRMWEGGMGPWGQFCIDFFDVERKVSVNLPLGHSLHPATVPTPPGFGPGYPPPGFPMAVNAPTFAMANELRSWERSMGMRTIPEGEEKWMVPQGAFIMLKREGHADVIFQIPTRQIPFTTLPTRMGAL